MENQTINPALEEYLQKLKEHNLNLAFIEENIEQLIERYPESYVAVYNSKIVGHGKKFETILWQLKRRGIPEDEAAIKYLDKRLLPRAKTRIK